MDRPRDPRPEPPDPSCGHLRSEDAGDIEEILALIGREDPPRALFRPDPEEIPVYDPEALVW